MDPLIILAIVISTAMVTAMLLDRRAAKSTHTRSLKASLSSCIPPPPVVHFGYDPGREMKLYPTNQEVADWGSKGDVVKLRDSEPKIKTNGNDAA